MDPHLWSHAKSLLDATLQRAPEDREAFLDASCAGDLVLKNEVERLLMIAEEAESFFDTLSDGIRRPAPPVSLGVPDRIGPWQMVREIGRGGMGRVWLAEHAESESEPPVAIKLVEAAVPGLVERFQRERRILGALDHPNVARLLGGGALPDGRPYLVMEYVEGEPITEYTRAQLLDVESRLRLFVQVCNVVAYAHQNLVVHRDLKPRNILVESGPNGGPLVKLLDFGIARLLEVDGEDLTRTGQRLHTPVYAAPEQIRGDRVTTATDVYGLGVVLHELLTGQRPFERNEEGQEVLEQRILEDTPTLPSARARISGDARVARRLAGDLDRIVLTALRKEPERRYRSVEALGRDVERHLAGQPIEARRPSVGYRVRAFVRRHRIGVAATASVLLASLAFGTLYTLRVTSERNRAEAAASRAERVSDFLGGILARAEDPAVDKSSLLRILQPAAQRADAELSEDPEEHAAVLHALGTLYSNLKVPGRADSLFRQALAIQRAIYDTPSEETAETLYELGVLHIPTPDSALAFFREAGEIRESLGTDVHDLAWSLLQWDRMLPPDHPEKGSRYERALDLLKREHGARSPEVAEAIHEYHVLGLSGHDPGPAFEEVLEIYQENGIEEDPRTLYAMYNLGLYYEKNGDFEKAFPLFRRAVRIGEQVLPPGSPELATMTTNFGATLHEQGRLSEADRVLAEVAASTRVQMPEGARTIQHSHYWYGRNLLALGRAEEAERALRLAWSRSDARGAMGARLHRTQIELAWALAEQGRYRDAEPLLRESAAKLRGTPNEAVALQRLADVYAAMGSTDRRLAVDARLAELQ